MQTYFYRPQRSCEGYIFTGVCLSTGGSAPVGGAWSQGVCSWGGCLLPEGGPGPGGCLLLGGGGAWSGGGVCSWGGLVGGVGIPACTEADTLPGEMATAADGTHPTGMHSCFNLLVPNIQRGKAKSFEIEKRSILLVLIITVKIFSRV